eukprot:TRINITY_DN74877_c0_g1_i1.p1 TRINITY_DN74877_c0_g1~~TRINITY_DN74877_c0_g1_i1.p1  ORF type:complete len:471 (-),score=76.26 TRINITY_DN74877_c0_g1_i1:95-1438(-)
MAKSVASGASSAPVGKYTTLPQDTRGHSSWFLTRTNREHQATMEHPFMKTIYAKNFDKEAYAQYLVGQYLIFRELEVSCRAKRDEMPLEAVYDEALHRSVALENDLLFWSGQAWEERLKHPSPVTKRYLDLLRSDAGDAWMLLCHHFLQYNAVLSGGQFLGGQVSSSAQASATAGAASAGKDEGGRASSSKGADLYHFSPECQPTHLRVQKYLDVVDSLTIHATMRDRMLARMREIYRLLLELFDEAFAVAPIEGVSYRDVTSQTASPTGPAAPVTHGGIVAGGSAIDGGDGDNGGGDSAKPPPPLEPGDRCFTLADLRVHDGRGEGPPQLLTSVLGRVYDVTSGKEFFGSGGPYEMFAGRDGTYNLAVMTLKKGTLDKFEYEFDDDDKECLSDWIAYFDNRYGRPLGVLSDHAHPVSLCDLPRATKIPFSGVGASEASSAQPASKL